MISIRKTIAADVALLKDRLRNEDEKEVISAGNKSVESCLVDSISRSIEAYTVEFSGNVVAIFGLVPDTLLGDSACVWFLGSEEMSKIKKSFVKISRTVLKHWLTKYNILWNIVDGRYEKTIKWLLACRANFEQAPLMRNGVPFYLFRIIR